MAGGRPALERLLLVATRAGLSASYLNQPIEVGTMRESLKTLLQVDAVPQLLLRVGRGPQVERAPRRPMSEVII